LTLSLGERKRLGLLLSLLEDRPIYLFDEWASDQDPEFKWIFYDQLLGELRSRGKLVIVISHDDRFFRAADKLLIMERGRDARMLANLHELEA
jgi:putative ATP-binding cassette transporter